MLLYLTLQFLYRLKIIEISTLNPVTTLRSMRLTRVKRTRSWNMAPNLMKKKKFNSLAACKDIESVLMIFQYSFVMYTEYIFLTKYSLSM